MINEMDDNGALTRTYFHSPQGVGRAALGHVGGANPASSANRYYTRMIETAALGCGDPGGVAQSAAGVRSSAGAVERGEIQERWNEVTR